MTKKKAGDVEHKQPKNEKRKTPPQPSQIVEEEQVKQQPAADLAAPHLRKDPPYESQSERPARSDDPGSLDEETLSAQAPYNKTYGVQGSKAE